MAPVSYVVDLGSFMFSCCKHEVRPGAVRERLSLLPGLFAVCLHPQLQWSQAHITVSLTGVVCFDSRACLRLHVPGLTELRSPPQMSCGVREIFNTAVLTRRAGGRGRRAAFAFRCWVGLSSEVVFAFIKKSLLGYENKDFPRWQRM